MTPPSKRIAGMLAGMTGMLAGIVLLVNVTLLNATPRQVTAATIKTALHRGDPLGVFYVTKAAGALDDGVEIGEELCYRCRYGSSAMVMVFTRRIDGKLPQLAQQLDQAVQTHHKPRFKALITLLGDDGANLKENAEQLATEAAATALPITIASHPETGPPNYNLPQDAEATVIVAIDSQVISSHSYASVEKINVESVMNEVHRLVH